MAHVGYFPETIPPQPLAFALVSLDADLYQPTYNGLEYFYPRLSPGGAIVIHDYHSERFSGVCQAVNAYCYPRQLTPVPLADLHGSVVLIKQGA